ncbi:unnamed protein product [Oppiella nova]|uniref:Uncharacterized protein n=1 Tax=Oppiella nova TaxID=334625 RepID=A0A7R9M3Z1_9ACAR|nr:unnamed protein product [Oppiella nova]CAG2170315.1 unnamed protein product [Oppiella nova]
MSFKTDQRLLVFDMSAIDTNWYNKNTRTYICYSCVEDITEWADYDSGFTTFEALEELGQRPEIRQFMVTRDLD